MILHFSQNEPYQQDAIRAALRLFEGQAREAGEFETAISVADDQLQLGGDLIVGNRLILTDDALLENVQAAQTLFNDRMREMPEDMGTIPLSTTLGEKHFSLEMETGTGKTYTYISTIHALHQQYGFKKFVIVVPSIAIREGVLKNLDITRAHFEEVYGRHKLHIVSYDAKMRTSAKRNAIKNFARSSGLEILVINIDAFAKDGAVIRQVSEGGEAPMAFLQRTCPIVIVDEPQNMETDGRKQAIADLNPLCTLRYSATHRYPYHLLYRLDPVRAYDLGLVKKIEVDSVCAEGGYSDAYVEVVKIESKGKKVYAKIAVDSSDAEGLQRKELTLRGGEDLEELTGREVYRGYVLDRIEVGEQYLTFANGKTYRAGEKDEGLRDELIRYQIRQTVLNHFAKEKKFKARGIKVLSLFFLDRVQNYRVYDEAGVQQGKYAAWFEEAYREMQAKPEFRGVLDFDAATVHDGYFSADKKGNWKDTNGETKDDDKTYNLIMRDKEKLLDAETPLRFIFSHSALREGWDNPNVFQICTLAESRTDMKKRQEIGRGLRLPIDSNGERVRDEAVNVLTVIANQSYESFAKALQEEMEADCGVSFAGKVRNAKQRIAVKSRKGFELDPNFLELWERISQKTRYRVEYDTDALVAAAARAVAEIVVSPPKIVSTTVRVIMDGTGIAGEVRTSSGRVLPKEYAVIPDILGAIQKRTDLTKLTILRILQTAKKLPDALKNPEQFIDQASECIQRILREVLVQGIKYEKIDGKHDWNMFKVENEELQLYLDTLVAVKNTHKTVHDYIAVDSDTVERPFAKDLDSREDVKFYFKLPPKFVINTPLGKYNPDWAVVFEGDARVYFVAETKGTDIFADLRPEEQMKIRCGKKHFEEIGAQFIAPVQTLDAAIRKAAGL